MSNYAATDGQAPSKVTINALQKIKQNNQKFSCLTAYDFGFSKLVDEAGIDVILVGDSLAMTVQGHETTVPARMHDMLYHTKIVKRGVKRSFIISDMPFASYANADLAIKNASKLLQAGAHMVKVEGDQWLMPIIKKMVEQSIPVCAHFGLTPQSILQMGSYMVQGKDDESANAIIKNCLDAEKAGAQIILLECVPAQLAEEITSQVKVPVIGIGAGKQTDGQILVLQDILGMTERPAKFTKDFLAQTGDIRNALKQYDMEVKNGDFPTDQHSF